MQPSGLLHLGNLMGALDNWKKLQDEYDCYYFIADWHALTTQYADTSKMRAFIREMIIDWLAAGIDPEKSVIFQQSRLPEHAVLHVLLSMITPLPWLERVPTYKEKMEQVRTRTCIPTGSWAIPCSRPRTFSSIRRISCPWASISSRTWSSPGKSAAGSTPCTAGFWPSPSRS